ncbi:hypothetical protein EKD04_018605 [Chloroflexales bacterium ZM16-3]|nr:hypothetical protein [Chloroflexales bacterium ZM16-3]
MRYIATWTIGLIALLAMALAPAGALAQSTMTSNVTPSMGPPGARFAFVATGFNASERVGVWVNTPAGEPMAITPEQLNGANGDGRADWYWTVPADAAGGTWQMVARGIDSGIQHVIPFDVVGDPASPLSDTTQTSNVTPSVGPPGARFAFVAIGFNASESVGVWVNTPSGEPMAITPEELNGANGDGRADWYWTSPDNAARGTWTMVARGVDSGVERVISFEIQ